jgi:chromosome segregation ATPase
MSLCRVEELSQHMANSVATEEHLQAENKRLAAQVSDLHTQAAEVARLNEQISKMQADAGSHVAQWADENVRLAEQVRVLEAQLQAHQHQAGSHGQGQGQAAHQELELENTRLTMQVSDMAGKLQKLEREVAQLRSQARDGGGLDDEEARVLRSERDVLLRRVDELEGREGRLVKAEAELRDLTRETEATLLRLEQLQRENAALRANANANANVAGSKAGYDAEAVRVIGWRWLGAGGGAWDWIGLDWIGWVNSPTRMMGHAGRAEL